KLDTLIFLQKADGGFRGARNGGRECRSENEGWRTRAHRIYDHGISGNVATERAEAFGKRSFDNIDPVHGAVALSDAATMWAVKTDGVDLVHKCQRVVAFGEIGDSRDWSDVAVHRIKAFENDELGPLAGLD